MVTEHTQIVQNKMRKTQILKSFLRYIDTVALLCICRMYYVYLFIICSHTGPMHPKIKNI